MNEKEILQRMSLQEKLDLCCGGDFWRTIGLPAYSLESLTMADGPHGLRYQEAAADMLGVNESLPATCFPTAVTSACSWNRENIREAAAAIAREAAARSVDVILGPGLNMKRNPLCGRNFEYFSEDPYLAGELGAAFVRGAKEEGIAACLKHFAGNSQEYKRFSSNDHLDERALREIYLPAFERAVKEGDPAFVMCAYNKINGTYCSDNKRLLTDILREEWGFSGAVVTDWGAMHDRTKGFAAGCDLSMPGGSRHHQRHVREAVCAGELSPEAVDASALRILKCMLHAQKLRRDRAGKAKTENFSIHHEIAKKTALESMVLLKNDGVLPLKNEDVCLVGAMAKHPRYQGAGSSHIQPTRLISLWEIGREKGWSFTEGCREDGTVTEDMLEQVRTAAKAAGTVVVVAGLTERYESEGFDRDDMQMPRGHVRMIEAAAEENPNTVVLLAGGSPMELPWFEDVGAVLYLGLPGQAGYEAAYDLLTGAVNPSGKLAETWPYRYEDVVSHSYYGKPNQNPQYRESIYVGYRYYETAGIPVRFPFGFGLSYTEFQYEDIRMEQNRVTVTVKNCGAQSGAEVVQLYIGQEEPFIHRPVRELKGFEKVFLEPGEKKSVTFLLDMRSFAVWQDGWKIPEGFYEIQVGASVRDIRLRARISVTEAEKDNFFADGAPVFLKAAAAIQQTGWYEHLIGCPSQQDLEALLGYEIPEEKPALRGNFTMENTIVEMAQSSLFLRAVKFGMERVIAKMYGVRPEDESPEFRMSMASSADSALFSAVNNGGRILPEHVALALLDVANGHFLKAVRKMIFKK